MLSWERVNIGAGSSTSNQWGIMFVQVATLLGSHMPLHPTHPHKGKEGTKEVEKNEI